MLPRLFIVEWGTYVFHLNGYGFSALLGTAAALFLVVRRARAASIPVQPLLWVLLLSVAGAFAGARLAFAIQYGRSPLAGGWVLYGGLIGGVATALAAGRRFGLAPRTVADLSVPGMLLAAAFGRIGCFFAGCCHGAVWDGGVTYPAFSHAWHAHVAAGLIGGSTTRSLPTIPAPLLEASALLLFSAATSVVWRRGPRPGTTLAVGGLLYSAWRFGAEFWRGDHPAYWGASLTFSQGVSLLVFAGSLLLLLARRPAQADVRRPPSPFTRLAAGQAAAILIAVAACCGSIGCSSQDRKDIASDVAEGCMEGCINACVDVCCESCADDCRSKQDPKPRSSPEVPEAAPLLRLPRLEPGSRHSGRFSLRGILNGRLDVEFDLAGDLQALAKDEAGTLHLRMDIQQLRLSVGTQSLPEEKGTLEFTVDSKSRTVLKTTTLTGETLSILKSVEPLTRGFFQIEVPGDTSPAWTMLIDRELNVPDPRGTMRGSFEINGERQTFLATALVTQTANGDKRVQWIFQR